MDAVGDYWFNTQLSCWIESFMRAGTGLFPAVFPAGTQDSDGWPLINTVFAE